MLGIAREKMQVKGNLWRRRQWERLAMKEHCKDQENYSLPNQVCHKYISNTTQQSEAHQQQRGTFGNQLKNLLLLKKQAATKTVCLQY